MNNKSLYLILLVFSLACQSPSQDQNKMTNLDKKIEQTGTIALENNSQVTNRKKTEPFFLDFEFGMNQNEIDELCKVYANDGRISICNYKNSKRKSGYCYLLYINDETIPMYMDISEDFRILSVIEDYTTLETFNKMRTFLLSKYGNDYHTWTWQGKKVPEFITKTVTWYLKNKTVDLSYQQTINPENDHVDRFLLLSFTPPTLNIPRKGETSSMQFFIMGQEDEYLKHKYGTPTQNDIKRTQNDF